KAERVLKFPFIEDPSKYVRCGDTWACIHAGNFADGVGDLLASPDGTQVIVERRFKGCTMGGVLIDLRTRNMTSWSVSSNNLDVRDWQRHRWRTRFELLQREELYACLGSGVIEDTRTALEELRIRGFVENDWLILATAFGDERLPEDC